MLEIVWSRRFCWWAGLFYVVLAGCASPGTDDGMEYGKPIALSEVVHWAYNIQDVHTDRQYDELVGTHFDLYVLEPTVTDSEQRKFDMAGLVHDIRRHQVDTRKKNPLILAYVDIGQAEAWRWYFSDRWVVDASEDNWQLSQHAPPWIVGDDPNGWDGNYPVAFWHPDWQDIVLHGVGGLSHVDATLAAGFDGIYMDWVEAFSDDQVIDALAAELGISPEQAAPQAAARMLDFIEKIAHYARVESPMANPDYLIVAQNASDLHAHDPARYERIVDGIALEAIWIDGAGGFDDWQDPEGFNLPTNSLYPGWTEAVVDDLKPLVGKMPIFCCEYAQDVAGSATATDVYSRLAPELGCIAYATRRSLARLSTTPYPAGYGPIDY